MIKKTVTYEDFLGATHTDTWYFHLTKAEVIQIAAQHSDGDTKFVEMFETISQEDTRSGENVVALFEMLLPRAVGVLSEDGKRFAKSDEIRDGFMQSNAYSEVLTEILMNPEEAVAFIEGMFPKDYQKMAADFAAKAQGQLELPEADEVEKTYTKQELLDMSNEDFTKAVGTDANKMTREHLLIAMERKTRKVA